MPDKLMFRWFITVIIPVVLIIFCTPYLTFGFSKEVYINTQEAVINTREWKSLFIKFKSDFENVKSTIKARKLHIEKMMEELNEPSYAINSTLKIKKEELIQKEKIDFERYVEDKNKEFSKREKAQTQALLEKMWQVIYQIAEQKHTGKRRK